MKFVIEHLSKSFEKKEVLKDINFTFEEGKIYGLLGRNGAGKTTLFNCLNRDLKIDSGSFYIDTDGTRHDVSANEIGYVLSKAYWGQGLMPEAVRGVIRWLFEEEKLDFLVCGHFVENLQSWRVQEKCGFVRYKRTPYTTQYGETKDHWISLLQR